MVSCSLFLCVIDILFSLFSGRFIDLMPLLAIMARVLPDEYRSPPTDNVDADFNRHLLCQVEDCPTCVNLLSVKSVSSGPPHPTLSGTTIEVVQSKGRERLSFVFSK